MGVDGGGNKLPHWKMASIQKLIKMQRWTTLQTLHIWA